MVSGQRAVPHAKFVPGVLAVPRGEVPEARRALSGLVRALGERAGELPPGNRRAGRSAEAQVRPGLAPAKARDAALAIATARARLGKRGPEMQTIERTHFVSLGNNYARTSFRETLGKRKLRPQEIEKCARVRPPIRLPLTDSQQENEQAK